MLDTDTGELEEKTLEHQGETVREFYSALPGPVRVGIEANRPALQELMAALHGNGTKLVLIEKLDRLARDLMIQESIVADLQSNQFETMWLVGGPTVPPSPENM
jgi:DNA invertase Pin-like site-specific DNA recombinase